MSPVTARFRPEKVTVVEVVGEQLPLKNMGSLRIAGVAAGEGVLLQGDVLVGDDGVTEDVEGAAAVGRDLEAVEVVGSFEVAHGGHVDGDGV
jgi:hypothetical protein